MKTLVIHPKDRSTDFLTPIYENIAGGYDRKSTYQEIRDSLTNDNIKQYGRIMFLGHGTPNGLLNVDGKVNAAHVFNKSDIVAFSGLDIEIVAIWCNADLFWFGLPVAPPFLPHDLLVSGMFISEVEEAHYMGIPPRDCRQKFVNESNEFFSRELGEMFQKGDLPLETIHDKIKSDYLQFGESFYNEIAKYNAVRLDFVKHI